MIVVEVGNTEATVVVLGFGAKVKVEVGADGADVVTTVLVL